MLNSHYKLKHFYYNKQMHDLVNNCTLQMFVLGSLKSLCFDSKLIQGFSDSEVFFKIPYNQSPSDRWVDYQEETTLD